MVAAAVLRLLSVVYRMDNSSRQRQVGQQRRRLLSVAIQVQRRTVNTAVAVVVAAAVRGV